MFEKLPPVPDHPALERGILELWERERTFELLREKTRGGPRFSFMDGPITANNPMGVHHLGRALKDVFQRYKALRGFETRYQNGFDSQGLHVEVEVEKSLGLNSKREIETYGLAEFAAKCRERVAHYAGVMTDQSKRLGMWMDWGNDYFTFSDTNIEYIWRFLKEVHRRGWLYKGHRSTQWCPRCGTSLSKHEQAGEENYKELEHPSLEVRFPLHGRDGESLVVWTTTPWTLPANVAAAVKPDAEYGRRGDGDWVAVGRYPDEHFAEKVKGEELVGLRYEGPFDHLPAQEGVEHRVIPWDEVSLDEGTGIVHIAPGCGAEDFELSRKFDLAVLMPIDESGRMLPGYGDLEGLTTEAVQYPVIESLRERGLLVSAESIEHRYPVCWRCSTPLVFRVVDDWFISAQEIRQPMLDGNATVEWTPPQYKKRMDDWLRNMGDWNISRRRYFGLPLPFYPCECGHFNVIGSRAELEERAVRGLDQLQELHRPWIDEVPIHCEDCDREVERIPEVGDAWLDAGIVHFSTLGWQNPEWVPEGNATGSARGLTHADLPDHAYWEQWFPADWVSEMREQIRLWFYSQCFMAITLDGRQPYRRVLTYEKVSDEHGREMHKSWGNAIEVTEALERMGADVMRWLYCDQTPSQPLRFGYGMAEEVKKELLTFWNSVSFFITYANIAGWKPGSECGEEKPLDRWLAARTAQLVRDATGAYERYWTPDVTAAFAAFSDDLSNWYIRRSRRRFWEDDPAALAALWNALTTALQVIAPVMPFLAEHLWRDLVSKDESVFLAGWPEARRRGRGAAGGGGGGARRRDARPPGARRVPSQASSAAAPARRPGCLASGLARGRDPRRAAREGDRVRRGRGDGAAREAEPPHPRSEAGQGARRRAGGARGRRLRAAGRRKASARPGTSSSPRRCLSSGAARRAGRSPHSGGITVALDTRLDPELELEGRVLDLIHHVNTLRKQEGYELTDRIVLTLPESHADVLAHEDWIKRETLAVEINGRLGRVAADREGVSPTATRRAAARGAARPATGT